MTAKRFSTQFPAFLFRNINDLKSLNAFFREFIRAIEDYRIRTAIIIADHADLLDGFQLPVKTDATRGSAGTKGIIIFNDDDGQMNVDDGTNWTLPDGTTT